MRQIVRKSWYFKGFGATSCNEGMLLLLKCSDCGKDLEDWYSTILKKLKKFLPKDFKTLCCCCCLREAVRKYHGEVFYNGNLCPHCKNGSLLLERSDKRRRVGFTCILCNKSVISFRVVYAYKLMQKYLRSSW